jgi:hypothetical protein
MIYYFIPKTKSDHCPDIDGQYLGHDKISMITKDKYIIRNRDSYPEIDFENIFDLLYK